MRYGPLGRPQRVTWNPPTKRRRRTRPPYAGNRPRSTVEPQSSRPRRSGPATTADPPRRDRAAHGTKRLRAVRESTVQGMSTTPAAAGELAPDSPETWQDAADVG